MKILAVILVAFGATRAVEAQERSMPFESCAVMAPAGQLTRVPVLVQADADLRGLPYLPAADAFAQSVAIKLRLILGNSASRLPEADSVIAWSRLAGELILTAHKNKLPTLRLPAWYPPDADTTSKSALALLRRAAELVVADGDGIPLVDYKGDSLAFRLSFVHPDVAPDGSGTSLNARAAAFAFTLAIPPGRAVEQLRGPTIAYPMAARANREINSVRLAFTVNQSGRAVVESVQELWPGDTPLPFGPQRMAYDALTRAVKAGLTSARYAPAMIGGCRVDQVVTQRFDFVIPEPVGPPARR